MDTSLELNSNGVEKISSDPSISALAPGLNSPVLPSSLLEEGIHGWCCGVRVGEEIMISCREERVERGKNRALENEMFRSNSTDWDWSEWIGSCVFLYFKENWVPDVC